MGKKSIVVLGAGFGGLRAAQDIAAGLKQLNLLDKYETILVDRNDCHLYTPLLYELAASPATDRDVCTYDISALVKKYPIRFVAGEIADLDLPAGNVRLKNGEEMHADYLVIAIGSETNFFGIPGLKENALQLKTLESAMQIREAVAKKFETGGNVNIVIGGAGPNGIELAAELRLWANDVQIERPGLKVSISIVEAMASILPGFPPNVTAVAINRLERLKIPVKLNTKITAVSTNEIGADNDVKIPFDIFVWTGGIKTPDMMTKMPLEKEPHGKPMAQSGMQCLPATPNLKLAPMIYGLGDTVCFMDPKTQRPVPAVARTAILEGAVAGHNLLEEIKKAENPSYSPQPQAYVPAAYPYVIPIGENWAVAKFGPFVFWGWSGSIFKKLIQLHYLISVMPWGEALKAWKKT